jgi:hypothetical protein
MEHGAYRQLRACTSCGRQGANRSGANVGGRSLNNRKTSQDRIRVCERRQGG